jgi:predicted phage terminase large subunit-like protein
VENRNAKKHVTVADVTAPSVRSEFSLQAVLHAALATDFRSFIQYAFGVLRPGIEFRSNWHIDAMAYKLSQVAKGEVKRLIITVPPRNLKSICASVALPAWFLGHNPSERAIAISYSADLAKIHANDFRRVVNDPLYRAVFPDMRVARDTDKEITTTLRGKRYATSIDGTLTGLGGNLFIIDDPIKLGDAFSEVVRKRTIDWYRETLLTRLDDKKAARIVVLMQRVHQQDLVGYLQEQDGQFEVLNLPAIAPAHVKIPTGPDTFCYRAPGQLLHPDHEPDEVLLSLRKAMGTMAFRAQYQQTPVSADGTFIKNKWLKSYSEIAFGPRDQIVMSWDIALSEAETGDYSAGVVLLNRGETFYVLEVVRGRFPFPKLVEKIVDMCAQYRGALLIEDSPISKGLIQALKNKNINVVPVTPDKDKRSRVIAQSDLFEGGSVFIRDRAEWREIFIRELLDFPGGRHDDQVDALVQGLAYQRGQWLRTIKVRATTGY